jgi:creatinine amidohydrolase
MVLGEMTWQEVRDVDRDVVVLVPTGSLEQHGPHLPLFTDTLLVTAVATEVERRMPSDVLLTPTLWLGASGHHLAFDGTLSADFATYGGALASVIESLVPHGFWKFFVLNGHGGNTEPNGIALRGLKARYPQLQVGHCGYFAFSADTAREVLEGPIKEIRHSCEAEVSLGMHLFPHLVRKEKLRDDGLAPNPPVTGMIHHFDEMTEEGSLGFATLATPEKGKAIFEAAVNGVCANLAVLREGYALESQRASS